MSATDAQDAQTAQGTQTKQGAQGAGSLHAPHRPRASPRTETPSMSSLVVRQAVLADLEPAAVLFDACRQFQGQPADLGAARAFLRARFEHGQSVVFLAHEAAAAGPHEARADGSGALGFAQLYPSFSSVALARVFILNDLFVAEAGRRRGVASALLAAVEAHAWAMGACRVTLNVALENREGQALYLARGWAPDAQFRMFHRFPAAGG